jgi:hypothetical protein
MLNETTKLSRKPQNRAERKVRMEYDVPALSWIGQQYAIRLDQLQRLFGQLIDRYAINRIGEEATRDVVTLWKNAGWVETEQIQAHKPMWIWLTDLGLSKARLPYSYQNVGQDSLESLLHRAAMNEIRLGHDNDCHWFSERPSLRRVRRRSGNSLLHRPDAVSSYRSSGEVIAIEVELSLLNPQELAENVMELIRGEEYLKMRHEFGPSYARQMSQNVRSWFTEIWYFGPKPVRRQVRQVCADLLKQGALSTDDADRLMVYWYPLPKTEQEEDQEEQEEHETPDLEESDLEEIRPSAEGRTGE